MTLIDIATPVWRIDAISILLLVLVAGIAAAVLPYAHRSLRGDRRGRGVTLAIAAMLVATAVVSISGELWMLALAWSASTAATLVALGLGGGRLALARATPWLMSADGVLWSAIVLAAAGAPGDVVAMLLVVTAAVRCALPPAHSWLVDSLHAPTPVSAALHGGIVNGGGILVITQIETITQSAVAVVVLAVVGAIGIVVGVITSLVRTDIKGRLVMSTVAQMGFMLLIAALGLVAAALLHLVAHGFYKSSLFLSSNDGIDRRAAERRSPRPAPLSRLSRRLRAATGAVVPVTALVATALLIYPGGRGAPELVVLIVLATAFGVAGARATLLMPSSGRAAIAALTAAAAAVAFVFVTSALTAAVNTMPGAPPTTVSFAGAIVVGVAFTAIGALLAVAALRQWAPQSPVALALLAWGHSVGAPARRLSSTPASRVDDRGSVATPAPTPAPTPPPPPAPAPAPAAIGAPA